MKKLIALAATLTLVFSVAACDLFEEEEAVELTYVNWAEGIAMNYLAHAILEDEYGYSVESTEADPGPVFASIADGDSDVFVDAWFPVTHETYQDEYGDDFVDLGYNFEGARIGLVVPDYVDIDSIDELPDHGDEFDYEIVGIGPGAGIMEATNQAMDEDYEGFEDWELVESSGPAMVAELETKIENDEWVVVTGWEPHHKFAADYELKFLDDPEGTYGDIENLHTVVREGFGDDYPELETFFENFYFTSAELGSLMDAMRDETTEEERLEAARDWWEDNEDLVDGWIE